MKSSEIRSRFLKFFENRGHAVIPSASLVTPDEKGITNPTLFNTAGMQPLVPYLLGKPHPEGKRLVDVQKVVRTVDIDDIGDKTHATFFEMLGNWSLGDYFKKEAIEWSYDFLTSKKEGLGLDPQRLYVTVFEGDQNAPRDEEAAEIWREIFKKNNVSGERIFYLSAKGNWWEAGENGPCGPDTEMFYDVANRFKGRGITHAEYVDADDKRDLVEIWNDVFMQYEKKDGKIIGKLPAPSVDTGAGLERVTMTMQSVDNIYDTDLLKPIMDEIRAHSTAFDLTAARIVADHIRAAVFLIGDGVIPSNTDRGYVLRKIIRRAVRHTDNLGMPTGISLTIANAVIKNYKEAYPNLEEKAKVIHEELQNEETKFRDAYKQAMKVFESVAGVADGGLGSKIPSADKIFELITSHGLSRDVIEKEAAIRGIEINWARVEERVKQHQELSRAGAEKKFKGGLADTSEMSVKYHTTTHLLHQALHDVLGDGVMQKGSNITPERLRFDFSHGAKMTDEEKKKVEEIVNKKIQENLPVQNVVMSKDEALKTGARHFFGEKYGDEVSIYFIGKDLQSAYSKEFCGGPHVTNTGVLGKFKIQKEEAISQGVRRIKAILE